MRSKMLNVFFIVLSLCARTAQAEVARGGAVRPTLPSTAFVHVNVVPMTSESALTGQTVLIQQGRMAEIGPSALIPTPTHSVVIDGHGMYLMPWLADTHVHLEGRSNFGDAPYFSLLESPPFSIFADALRF